MHLSFNLSGKLNCLQSAIDFFRKHFLVVMGFGLLAALGRVMQLGGFGTISAWMNIVLEVVVESARVLLFLYVLGLANVKNGLLRIQTFFSNKATRKLKWATAIQNLKQQWVWLLLNVTGFFAVAWAVNYLIDLLAYETCLFLALKEDGILTEASSEWTILLFFKNLSVIPFTIIFETLLVLWITKKVKHYSTAMAA